MKHPTENEADTASWGLSENELTDQLGLRAVQEGEGKHGDVYPPPLTWGKELLDWELRQLGSGPSAV